MSMQSISLDQPLTLEAGGVIDRPEVTYTTYGTLNEDKSNVTLICHALTASSNADDWWAGLFGADKVFDPKRDFIICINNLGSPYGTTSPKSLDERGVRYGLDFPAFTLRDNARLHIHLFRSAWD